MNESENPFSVSVFNADTGISCVQRTFQLLRSMMFVSCGKDAAAHGDRNSRIFFQWNSQLKLDRLCHRHGSISFAVDRDLERECSQHSRLFFITKMLRRVFIAAIFLIFSSGAIRSNFVIEQAVDCIEINHFHDNQARPVFVQTIFWNWVAQLSEYRVVDWRIDSGSFPRYNHRLKTWVSFWMDKKDNRYRRVFAPLHRETWTQHDPEIEDRCLLPCELRTGLIP
jgi:hypothetical protein